MRYRNMAAGLSAVLLTVALFCSTAVVNAEDDDFLYAHQEQVDLGYVPYHYSASDIVVTEFMLDNYTDQIVDLKIVPEFTDKAVSLTAGSMSIEESGFVILSAQMNTAASGMLGTGKIRRDFTVTGTTKDTKEKTSVKISVIADIEKDLKRVTFSASDGWSVKDKYFYPSGMTINLPEFADENQFYPQTFVGWSDPVSGQFFEPGDSIKISSDLEFDVELVDYPRLSIILPEAEGVVMYNGDTATGIDIPFKPYESYIFNAVPDPGYEFVKWTDGDDNLISEDPKLELVWSEGCNLDYKAVFKEKDIASVPISDATFPDPLFRDLVKKEFDTDKDNTLSSEEICSASTVELLYEDEEISGSQRVKTLKGIEYLTELRNLQVSGNSLTALDLSANTSLEIINAADNELKDIKLPQDLLLLYDINLSGNALTSVDLTRMPNVRFIYLRDNPIASVDLSANEYLNSLDLSHTKLKTVDLKHNHSLGTLYFSGNDVTSFDLRFCKDLMELDLSENKIKSIDLKGFTQLTSLDLSGNPISELDLSDLKELDDLMIDRTAVKKLDLSKNPKLRFLNCSGIGLKELDLSNNPELCYLYCPGNNIDMIDLTANPILADLVTMIKPEEEREEMLNNLLIYFYENDIEEYSGLGHDTGTILMIGGKAVNKPATPTPTVRPTATAKPTSKTAPTSSVTPKGGATVTAKPTVAPDASGSKIRDFVDRIYKYVLNREPEEDGAKFWTEQLYDFKMTGAEVGLQFVFSKEFEDRNTTDEEFVTILYKTFFGREPEEEGFEFWVDTLKNGSRDRAAVASGFIYSQEWADTCAEYGIRSGGGIKPSVNIEPTDATYAFVERMYTTAMKRASDEEGAKFWASGLANFDYTGEQVGTLFFLSEEMENFKLDNKEFVTRLYKTFMDRDPEEEGFAFWVKYLDDGNPRAGAVLGFTRSAEFVDKCIEARILPY